MEKNMYETYEYLPTNSADAAAADQFFVVQNDGTLLINRQVQYVTQVQDVKGALENEQPCTTVYDVSSQPYYVDVGNSTELISVSDQYALSQDANGDFGNNYLLQSIPSIPASTVEMPQPSPINDLKDCNIKMEKEQTNSSIIHDPETTNFTEVTLNDEQYRMLEVKGWILLETNGKVYLLNTLGLHDITDNKKLIEDLRNDVDVIEPSDLNNTTKNPISYGFEEIVTEPMQPKPEPQELILATTVANIQSSYEEARGTEIMQESLGTANLAPVASDQVEPDIKNNSYVPRPEKRKPSLIVRLKSNVAVEDIPNKIVLGKTVNGKRLVAKVMSIKRPLNKDGCSKNNPQEPDKSQKSASVVTKTVVNKKTNKEAYYRAEEVESLMHLHWTSPTELNSSVQDVKSAEVIIKQLLNVRATRTPLMERDLIITRIVKTMKDADNLLSEIGPTLVTGRVAQFDEEGEWHFIYIPHLLQELQKNVSSDEIEVITDDAAFRHSTNKTPGDYLLHIHIVEIKSPDVPTKTSITFSKKRFPARLQILANKAIYACSACAKIFASELELNDHQTSECMEVEDEKLIIDTDKISKQQNTLLMERKALASMTAPNCLYCDMKVKISNYKRHLQSHFGPVDKSGSKNADGSKTMYKCKMCSTTYYHASTLSKHILSHHIKSNICTF